MRIVSGDLKGRRVYAPEDFPVRPTTDLAKESLFNILNNWVDFEELNVLDLFAGIGSVSYEFVSRGAQSVVAVDNNYKCVDFIRETSKRFHIENRLQVIKADAFNFIQKNKHSFNLVFADPPYDLSNLASIPDLIFEHLALKEDAYFILEHSAKYDFSKHSHFLELRKYGKVHFSFFKPVIY